MTPASRPETSQEHDMHDSARFPWDSLPVEPRAQRLAGLYPQRQPGLWMQRIKVLGGRLTRDQWTGLGDLARRYSPRAPLHLTTRQDIELHDLSPAAVPRAQHALAELGLTGLGACGDTLRNITVCPCAGLLPGRPELIEVAWTIRRALEAQEGLFALPRKFKIALACGDDCGQPWINDLGLAARRLDGRWGFRVVAGGSLGPRAATGIVLFDWLAGSRAVPLAVAAVRVFAAEGDRSNRTRARLRHVRQRLGDEAFAAMLRGALEQAEQERPWPAVALDAPAECWRRQAVLTFANGDLWPDQAAAIGELAARGDLAVRIANCHRLVVFARGGAAGRDDLRGHPVLAAAARPQHAVVACPGRRWCARGLVDAPAAADRLRAALADLPVRGLAICVSGCPNGCAQHAVADVGLLGRLVAVDGRKEDAFDILVGGGMGRSADLARPGPVKVPVACLAEAVRSLLAGADRRADGARRVAGGAFLSDFF